MSSSNSRSRVAGPLALFIAVLSACAVSPSSEDRRPRAHPSDHVDTSATPPQKNGPRASYFPNVLLQTHEGRRVRFYDDLVAGKIIVVNFMYTRCDGT